MELRPAADIAPTRHNTGFRARPSASFSRKHHKGYISVDDASPERGDSRADSTGDLQVEKASKTQYKHAKLEARLKSAKHKLEELKTRRNEKKQKVQEARQENQKAKQNEKKAKDHAEAQEEGK